VRLAQLIAFPRLAGYSPDVAFSLWIDEALARLSKRSLPAPDAAFIEELMSRRKSGSRKIAAREVRRVADLDRLTSRGKEPGASRRRPGQGRVVQKRAKKSAKVIPLDSKRSAGKSPKTSSGKE
jgi:hypothetical protein